MPAPTLRPDSRLGPADIKAIAQAAEVLRDRTMSFEENQPFPAKRLVLSLMGLTALVAGGVVFFRAEVKWLLSVLM
jgi:hypothetical protein